MNLEYHIFQIGDTPATVYNRTISQFKRDLEGYPDAEIWIDDGRLSGYNLAWPVLQDYGRKAHFAPIVDRIGDLGYMSWDMLRELLADGHKIETHTLTHRKLIDLPLDEIEHEIRDSAGIIENKLGVRPKYLVAPHNKINDDIKRIAAQYDLLLIPGRKKMYSYGAPDYWNDNYTAGATGAEKGTAENMQRRIAQATIWLKTIEWQTLIDVGAGHGAFVTELKARNPDKTITASDLSEAAKQRSNYRPYIISSCYDIPGRYDVLTCMQTLEYLDNPERFIKHATNIAKHVFISIAPQHPTGRQFTKDDFAALLGPKFQVADDGHYLYGATK